MSEFMQKKAQSIIDTESILQIDNTTYQVKSSSGKSYIIENGICECMGFRFRNTCSHVLAVKILDST